VALARVERDGTRLCAESGSALIRWHKLADCSRNSSAVMEKTEKFCEVRVMSHLRRTSDELYVLILLGSLTIFIHIIHYSYYIERNSKQEKICYLISQNEYLLRFIHL